MEASDSQPLSGLSRLYRDLRGELLRFLVSRLGDAGEAEEVVQELYLRIHAATQGPVANGRAYLYRAAQNLALDRIRERRRRVARDGEWLGSQHSTIFGSDVVDDRADAERVLVDREQAAALATAIASLPKGAGQVFRLHKLEGVSHAEIACRLGISRSGVEKHLAVAMTHLRRAMKD